LGALRRAAGQPGTSNFRAGDVLLSTIEIKVAAAAQGFLSTDD
jgi:hypothetical protein